MFAHRGVVGPAPENSLESIRAAIEAGADWAEVDVRRTATGELILHHDARVGPHLVSDLDRERITSFSGIRPPLLEDAVRLAAGRIGLDLEVKERGCVDEVAEIIGGEGDPELTLVTSFLPDVVMAFAATAPLVGRGLLVGGGPTGLGGRQAIQAAQACGSTHLGIGRWQARPGLLEEAAGEGLATIVWTVDRPEALRRLLSNHAVLGVVTNRARLALELRREVEFGL